MNRNDIDRMISQTENKYLDEILEGDVVIPVRKRSYFGIGAAAAAVIAAFVCGAAVLRNDQTGIADDVSPVVSETVTNESDILSELYSEETQTAKAYEASGAEAEADRTGDYSVYFRKDGEYTGAEYNLNPIGCFYLFGNDYTIDKIPFDTSAFEKTSADVYLGSDGKPAIAEIILETTSGDADWNSEKPYAVIRVSKERYYGDYDLDPQKNTPQPRKGAALYGFDVTNDGAKLLQLYFENGGNYYSCYFANLGYDEAIAIADGIIEKGLSVSDFDIEKASGSYLTENKNMSLFDANYIYEFAGMVPQEEKIIPVSPIREKYILSKGKAAYSENSQNGEAYCKHLILNYVSDIDDKHFIAFDYQWYLDGCHWYSDGGGQDLREKKINLSELFFDDLDGLGEETEEEGYSEYNFAAVFGKDRYISVSALCTKEQLGTVFNSMFAKYPVVSKIPKVMPGSTEGQGLPRLTVDDIKELAKKGDELSWDDFTAYECMGCRGSGIYVLAYPVDGGSKYLNVQLQGIPGGKPESIALCDRALLLEIRNAGAEEIDGFIAKNK